MIARHEHRTLKGRAAGFTMIELLIAFSMMVILLTTVFVIFDTGSRIFSTAGAQLEIMEMARTVFQIMGRDVDGATLDGDGRVFRGYSIAFHSHVYSGTDGSGAYAKRRIFGIPGETDDWRNTSFYLWASSARKHGHNYSDLLWFRTNTAPEARGGQAEVIYRLARGPGGTGIAIYYGGTLERCIRTSWPPSVGDRNDPNGPYLKVMPGSYIESLKVPAITTFPPQKLVKGGEKDTVMQVIPLAPFCYDIRFDFLNSFRWDVRDERALRFHEGASYEMWTHFNEVWPPRYGPMSERPWATGKFTVNECRRHLPAAVKVWMRLGDLHQDIWTDQELDFGSWQRDTDGQLQVDEVGMVFEQIFFIPNHVRYPYGD